MFLLRRRVVLKYVLAAFVAVIVYCEWFVYFIQQAYWTRLECEQEANCVKILFIADPQIEGDKALPPPLSYIVKWDSDRYLKSTFKVVADYFKPDILVFLGDLMAEGSISTEPQFNRYIKRLSNIFILEYPAVQIWVPGESDIGGESGPIRHNKLKEFEKQFKQPSIITYCNVSIYKVNSITYTFPQKSDDKFKIVVSHYPITVKPYFNRNIVKRINPHIFFCGHDHESKYIKQRKDLSHKVTTLFNSTMLDLSITFHNDVLYEIFVPTCSYRMGTNNMGYGAAVLDNDYKHMRYKVFWSPARYPCICLYLGIVILCLAYSLVFYVAEVCNRKLKPLTKTPEMEV